MYDAWDVNADSNHAKLQHADAQRFESRVRGFVSSIAEPPLHELNEVSALHSDTRLSWKRLSSDLTKALFFLIFCIRPMRRRIDIAKVKLSICQDSARAE